MHRQLLLDHLEDYCRRHPGEAAVVSRMRAFVERRSDCFLRSCSEGHVTASSWIVSPDHERFLLAHHKKLDAWLQLGGHADGEPDPAVVALTEAREESGLEDFVFIDATDAGSARPFDLDIHEIPEHDGVPAHLHYDVRYLLLARADGPLLRSDESHDLRWWNAVDDGPAAQDESLRRMARKAHACR